MTAYTLNDYYKYVNSTATRVEVYSDNNTATNLLVYHKQNGAVELAVSECVSENALHLPMPDALMEALDAKIAVIDKRVVVTGIDAYLALLSDRNVSAFMVALHYRIDASKLNVAFLVNNNRFDKSVFKNEKYKNALDIVYIGETGQYLPLLTVSVVSEKWIQRGNNPANWRTLLKTLGQFEPTGDFILVLENYSLKHAGLSDNVTQLLDVASVAEKFYGIGDNLPKTVLETLIAKCKESKTTPIEALKAQFGNDNINIRLAVKRLFELRDDATWAAYVWFLKKFVDSDSYLAKVLSADLTVDKFLRSYVCDTAIILLDDTNAIKYATERAAAIKEIGNTGDSLIIEFISKVHTQPSETVACWLNCGTEAERIEIIRRVSESDLTVGLSQIWHNLYPLLADYLSDAYDYGNEDLTAYFRAYRRNKITNSVSVEFVKRAFGFILPTTFGNRDAALQELSADENTALLVVDGMGAEYFPLILAMAKRKAMNVESAVVAAAKLPTSTKFNHINWDAARRLVPINKIDNIVHNGAVEHEVCAPQRNIEASLQVFEDVINRVANGLTQFRRVVVTSDHGSSRLAVIAHENGLDTTLPWDGEPQDWRYVVAPQNMTRPSELEPHYDVDKSITYWVARGYIRLPKKGPKLNELHGGASLEERLVPIVVFSKAKVESKPQEFGKQTGPQLVEKEDYDI